MPLSRQLSYLLDDEVYHADDCRPLEAAVKRGTVQLEALVRGNYPGKPMVGNALDGVRSIGYWNASSAQDWGLDWHRNEGLEITFLSSGQLPFATEGFEGLIRSGQLTITRPWQAHRVGDPHIGASHLYWFIIDLGVRRPNQTWTWPGWISLTNKDLQRLTRILRQNETPVWQANRAIRDCWIQIGRTLSAEDLQHRNSRLQIHISGMLIEVLSLLEASNPELDSFLSSAERSVELFLNRLEVDLDLVRKCRSVQHMADLCNLSETRFSQLCHALVNQPPGRYLSTVRIRHAQKIMTRSPRRNITEIALECGFESSQYFATVFRQNAGMSPRRWREVHAKSEKV